jgi:hypothetical protein
VGTATVQLGGYLARAERLAISSRLAKLTKSLRVMTLWRLYVYETLLERRGQDLQDVGRNSGRSSRNSTPLYPSGTSPGLGTWPPPIRPRSEIVWCGARNGRVVPRYFPRTAWRMGLEPSGQTPFPCIVSVVQIR